jgi:hypothetical protein
VVAPGAGLEPATRPLWAENRNLPGQTDVVVLVLYLRPLWMSGPQRVDIRGAGLVINIALVTPHQTSQRDRSMSAVRGKADVPRDITKCPFMTRTGYSPSIGLI